MSMRTALGKVKGLGSAKEGTAHWWAERVTSVALVPLVLWFAMSLIGVARGDHATVVAWIQQPSVAVLLVVLLATTFYHASLAVKVLLEDYAHNEGVRLVAGLALKFALVLLAATGIIAVLRIAIGG